MRHRVGGRKLDLPSDQRMALLRGLVRSLVMYEHIDTTEPRAKEARVMAEKLITLSKQNTLHARREARKILPAARVPRSVLAMHGKAQKDARAEIIANDPVKRLFDVVGPKFAEKQSGFTRIIKIGFRRGDAARLVRLELAVD